MIVTIAGSPSGIAATANEIEVNSMSTHEVLLKIVPTKNMITAMIMMAIVRNFPSSFKLRFNGVSVSWALASMPAIFPTSVPIPVLTTTPLPRP